MLHYFTCWFLATNDRRNENWKIRRWKFSRVSLGALLGKSFLFERRSLSRRIERNFEDAFRFTRRQTNCLSIYYVLSCSLFNNCQTFSSRSVPKHTFKNWHFKNARKCWRYVPFENKLKKNRNVLCRLLSEISMKENTKACKRKFLRSNISFKTKWSGKIFF